MTNLRARWNEVAWEEDGQADFRNSVLVLQLATELDDRGQRMCEYYFANHKHRILVWRDKVESFWWYLCPLNVKPNPELVGMLLIK
jgi:hypothetical protein